MTHSAFRNLHSEIRDSAIPGPDPPAGWRAGLTNMAVVQWTSLIIYYCNISFIQASCARAGRNPKSEMAWEADELLAITVASINTVKRGNRKK